MGAKFGMTDPVPMDQHKGVVYRITCGGCPKVYVGQTRRTLKHRLTEHCRALRISDVASSAVAEHALSTGYPVDLSQSEVIDSQPSCMYCDPLLPLSYLC